MRLPPAPCLPHWPAWAVLLLCCSLPAVLHGTTVAGFDADYRIKRAGLTLGTTRLSFTVAADGSYTYRSTSGVGGFLSWFRKEHVRESSHGRIDTDGIRPEEYLFRRTGDRGDRTVRVHFDWPAGRAVNTVNGVPWRMDISPGTLDKLVVQIAIMQRLRDGAASELEFSVADGGRPKHYRIRVLGRERVDVAAGEFDAVRVEQEADNISHRTTLWAAPELGYLPVRIMREEADGAVYYSELENVTRQTDR